MASKTDANGNKETYTYDNYQRLTYIYRFPGGTNEDLCQIQTFTYDGSGNLQETTFGGYPYGGPCGGPNQMSFLYDYTYTPAGNVTGKSMLARSAAHTYNDSIPTYVWLTANYGYDSQGVLASVTYPAVNTAVTYTYGLDAMERPTGLTDSNNTTWASGVTYNAANQIHGRHIWRRAERNAHLQQPAATHARQANQRRRDTTGYDLQLLVEQE